MRIWLDPQMDIEFYTSSIGSRNTTWCEYVTLCFSQTSQSLQGAKDWTLPRMMEVKAFGDNWWQLVHLKKTTPKNCFFNDLYFDADKKNFQDFSRSKSPSKWHLNKLVLSIKIIHLGARFLVFVFGCWSGFLEPETKTFCIILQWYCLCV